MFAQVCVFQQRAQKNKSKRTPSHCPSERSLQIFDLEGLILGRK